MPHKYEELLKRFGFRPQRKPFPGSTPRTNLPPSLALLAPTFPTFSALTVENERSQTDRKRDGLYSSLLGNPQVLLQDLLANPAKYESGVAELLQELHTSKRKLEDLTTAETELLDRATVDFTQPNRSKPVQPPPVKKTEPRPVRYNKTEPSKPAPTVNGMEPYWWLK